MPRERRLQVPEETREAIRSLHPETRRKVRDALESILGNPSVGEPLLDELAGLNRVRVGPLRIVYRIATRTIDIVAIGPRARIYADLAARLRRGKGRSPQGSGRPPRD